MSTVRDTRDKDYTVPPPERQVHRTKLEARGRCLKAACRETKQEWDELVPLILMSYRATPQASTEVTPNMMMLGRQTRLPVQAMYGTPLGQEEEESTVSEYVAALQGGLRAAYRHAREGLQRAALHQKRDYDGKVQSREYQAGELVWIHDIMLERTRERMTLVEPAASPVTSLPCTQGRDILLPGDSEESPRSREGRVAAAMLEQEMGRRSVAAAIRPIKHWAVASSSSAQRMVAEACDTLIREKHPASPPEWPKDTGTPAQGDQGWPGETGILQEPPLPRRKMASTPRPERGGSPTGAEQGPVQPCSVQALSSGKKNHRPYAHTSQRPRSLGATRAASQRTGEV